MRIDLHTHSLASDGTQTPHDLVVAAKEAGLDVVAITDHDTSAGWDEAVQAALEAGIHLVRGMEISTRHHGHGVHLLAYLPDPTHPDLLDRLGRIVEGRDSRLPAMLEKLAAMDMPLTLEDVRNANPGTTVPGRPHVADALAAAGPVTDRDVAFAELLGTDGPAYVDRYAADLTDMIDVVGRAGGVTVIAHPWGRGGEAALPPDAFAPLVAAGLSGIEVDHLDHDPTARAALTRIAREHDLVVTGSSDHHGTGKRDHHLGVCTTDADQYARLLELAAAAAAASGRRPVTEVVRG